MTVSQAMWAMMGVFGFLAVIFGVGIGVSEYRYTARRMARAAVISLGVAVASAVSAIWLSVAGL